MGPVPARLLALWLAASEPTAPPDDAPAEAKPLDIDWSAPAECPRVERVIADVERFLAEGESIRVDARTRVSAVVRREAADRYTLELRARLPGGAVDRSISAERCDLLASAAALVIAVVLEPVVVLETVETKAVAPRPATPPAPAPKPTPEPRPRTRFGGFVRATGVGAFGVLPRFGGGVAGAAGLRIVTTPLAAGRLEVSALYEAPQRASADGMPEARALLQLWTVGGRGCWAPAVRKVEFPLCAGAEVGVLRGEGVGLAQPRTARQVWSAAHAGGAVAYAPIRWIALWLGVEGYVAMQTPRFVVDDVGPIHRGRRGGVRIHAGLEVRFP
jgi:hypothetical protein